MDEGEDDVKLIQPTLISRKDKAKETRLEIENPNRVVLKSVIERSDPANLIKNQNVPVMTKDVQGYLIALQFEMTDYSSYEIYSYVEETLKTEVDDLSIFRSPFTDEPTGLVIVQLVEDCSTNRLQALSEQLFKGFPVQVRLFSNEIKFLNFLENNACEKIKSIYLPPKQSTPIIFVQNFVGDEAELSQLFGRCGRINLIRMSNIKTCIFYSLYYDKEVSTRLAVRNFNGLPFKGAELIVSSLYHKSGERCFGVSNCDSKVDLRREIENFGGIEHMKDGSDGTIYVMMDSQNAAKFACTLINSRKIGSKRVMTFFIEFEHFQDRDM